MFEFTETFYDKLGVTEKSLIVVTHGSVKLN